MRRMKEPDPDAARALLRHAVATIAYRTGKIVRDAPEAFGSTAAGPGTRSALQILAHMADLFDWALMLASGRPGYRPSEPLPWTPAVERLFASLAAFDALLAGEARIAEPLERLLQGPIADALTHAGQLALLRRLCGAPVRGENYFAADIAAGRTGLEQAPPQREFD